MTGCMLLCSRPKCAPSCNASPEASVRVDGRVVGQIGRGSLVLLGVGVGDGETDAEYLAEKVLNLRIFPDDAGSMNRSLVEIGGELLVVSQFTLQGDARKGRRPSFIDAAPPEEANRLYRHYVDKARGLRLAGRGGRVPGHDGGRPRQRRTGDHPSRQP